MSLSFTILGCGSPAGVPRIGQGWGACDPDNPKNRRRRCSILRRAHRARWRQDASARRYVAGSAGTMIGLGVTGSMPFCSPIRMRTIFTGSTRYGLSSSWNAEKSIFIWMPRPAAIVRNEFGYIFETPTGSQYPALLNEHRIITYHNIKINGFGGPVEAVPFQLEHGEIGSLGFRFGRVAYTPDLNAIPKGKPCLSRRARSLDRRRFTLHSPSQPFLPAGNTRVGSPD